VTQLSLHGTALHGTAQHSRKEKDYQVCIEEERKRQLKVWPACSMKEGEKEREFYKGVHWGKSYAREVSRG
jgi:hypothetical protein